jgi:hypothetical protein
MNDEQHIVTACMRSRETERACITHRTLVQHQLNTTKIPLGIQARTIIALLVTRQSEIFASSHMRGSETQFRKRQDVGGS